MHNEILYLLPLHNILKIMKVSNLARLREAAQEVWKFYLCTFRCSFLFSICFLNNDLLIKIQLCYLRSLAQPTVLWATALLLLAAMAARTIPTPRKLSSAFPHSSQLTTRAPRATLDHFRTHSISCEICWAIRDEIYFVE